MITETWHTSERKYGVAVEHDVAIPLSDGITLDCDIFRPNAKGKFPAILGIHAYEKDWQLVPAMPRGMGARN